MGKKKKKKNTFIFAWISDIKAGFPTALFPADSPNAAVPSARERGRGGGGSGGDSRPQGGPSGLPPLPRSSSKDRSLPQALSHRGTALTGPRPGHPRPQCRTTTAPAGKGGQRHRSAAAGPPAARGRGLAAASISPSPAGPWLLTCPSAPPCYCGRGGRVNPGSRFLRVPFRQRRRASGPASGAASPHPAAILGTVGGGGFFCGRHLECGVASAIFGASLR